MESQWREKEGKKERKDLTHVPNQSPRGTRGERRNKERVLLVLLWEWDKKPDGRKEKERRWALHPHCGFRNSLW